MGDRLLAGAQLDRGHSELAGGIGFEGGDCAEVHLRGFRLGIDDPFWVIFWSWRERCWV